MSQQISENAQDEPLLTLSELAGFIKQTTGIPFGPSTMEKLCSPAINDGPKPITYIGKRPLFARDEVIRWAKARLSAKPKASAHNWPEKERERFEQRNADKRAAKAAAKAAKPRSSKKAVRS
jgi:hypothetical protein